MAYIAIDEGTDKKIFTLTRTEGSDTVHIQAFAYDLYDVYLDTVIAATTSSVESSKINCVGKPVVYFKVLYSNNADTADFVVFYYDANDVKTVSDVITVANTGIEDPNHSGNYIGELVTADTAGFSKVSIFLKTPPANDVIALGGGTNGDII